MPSDGRLDENSSMSSLSRDRLLAGMRRRVKSAEAPLQLQRAQMSSLFFLFFFTFWLLLCGRCRREQTQPWKIQRKKHNHFQDAGYTLWGDTVIVCFLSLKQVCRDLRDVSQGVLELSAQIAHVLPLLL